MSKILTCKKRRLFFNRDNIPVIRNTLSVVLASKHLAPRMLKAALSVEDTHQSQTVVIRKWGRFMHWIKLY